MTSSAYTDGRYLAQNASWHVEDSAWKARQILGILERNAVHPTTLAEVGCGAGEILAQLARALPDARLDGYDVSPDALALAATRATDRLTFHLADLTTEVVRVDCLLCIDVVEHVEDYLGFLRALRSTARVAVFHIPLDVTVLSVLRDKMLAARNEVGHLHYFTPATALATLRDCGYRIIDSAFTPAFRDVPGRSVATRLANIPRRMLYWLSPRLMVRWLGGASLLVLAE